MMNLLSRVVLAVIAALQMASIGSAQQTLSEFDRIKVAVQQICPVSGNRLDSKANPLKVRIGQETIFLCCNGCAKGKINKAHWESIHRNFAAAQGICPVMEKPLPKNPKWTVVNGQMVYICCPPCTKKIQADPKLYLSKLAGYYQSAVRNSDGKATGPKAKLHNPVDPIAKLSEPDRILAAVQKICPVSGNVLGATGIPQKVRVGEMDVFLCCQGCREGKVDKSHWKTIANNIRLAQSKCPVMEKDLPANAKSIVVDGKLVFVCCPPCTKKIEKDPNAYLAKVDAYYRSSLGARQRVAKQPSLIAR